MIKKSFCALCTALMFGACSFFTSPSSIFKNLDVPDTEAISQLAGEALVQEVLKNKNSAVFYTTLTQTQRNRMLDSLEKLTKDDDFSVPAARAQIMIMYNTNELVNQTINNFADPILEQNTYKTSIQLVFAILAAPILHEYKTRSLDAANQICEEFFIYNCRILDLYSRALPLADPGQFDGADIQICAVAVFFSSVAGGIKSVNETLAALQTEFEAISHIQSEAEFTQIVAAVENDILGLTGKTVAQILESGALVLEQVAENSGYLSLGKALAALLTRQGS